MNVPSLKNRVSKISAAAFVVVLFTVLAGFALFSVTKKELAKKEVVRELSRNGTQQIEQLIPSFLLPEQRAGIDLILSRISQDEGLSAIRVLQDRSELPDNFKHCFATSLNLDSCMGGDGRETGFIVPITESGRSFGYLFKAKHNSAAGIGQDIIQIAVLVTLMLAVAFAAIYFLIARLLSRTVPTALRQLVAWIESDLSENPSDISPLPFQELESLRSKISEILERHGLDRDQALVGQLTSGIMHDLRTPLHPVVTALHLVEKYPEGHPKRLARLENLANTCKESLPVIGRIIETTLDSSRQIHIAKENADLVQTIRAAVAQCSEVISLRKASIEITAPECVVVPHDPPQVMRVIHNLIKNGIEAVAEQDKTPKLKISIAQSELGDVSVAVDDNGAGFKGPAHKVFRTFRSSKAHGSGLGLHISRKIIEAHRGSVEASTSSFGGSRFEIRLPQEVAI